jgi:hypothetical protein
MHGGSSLALLQAGLAELDDADANDLTDGQVRAEVTALLAAVNQLTAVLSVRVGVFDARDLSTGDGFKTTRSWLVATRMPVRRRSGPRPGQAGRDGPIR